MRIPGRNIASALLIALAALAGCAGRPVPAQSALPAGVLDEKDPQVVTQAEPDPGCGKPSPPGEMRRRGLTGLVLVSFVVRESGSVELVEEISHKDPPMAPEELAQVVRDWLAGCRFMPARAGSGAPLPVRMSRAFSFKAG